MTQVHLSDREWEKVCNVLREERQVYIGQEASCRRFVEAVLWITRSGAQWRLLPSEYGQWNTVYKRFARWCEAGVWERLFTALTGEAELDSVMIDSTTVRAHPCAAGAQKNGRPSAGA